MKNLPDFCVSSKATGFDEFLKVFNEYFNQHCIGNLKYYGIDNRVSERYVGNQSAWTPNIITPTEAIALLTGTNHLTEGEQLIDKSKHKLLYSNLTKDFTWCGVCNEHFHNSEGYHDVKLLPTQEEKSASQFQSQLEVMNIANQMFPTQESAKHESKEDIIKNTFGEYSYKLMGASGKSQIMICMDTYSTQQTAHLQQQLKEAKELITETVEAFEIEVPIGNSTIEKLKSFLTRNK